MSRCRPSLSGRAAGALTAVLAIWGLAAAAHAAPPPPSPSPLATAATCVPPHSGEALQLEVFRNGEPTGLIGAFMRGPDGRLSASAQELRALGLAVPGACPSVNLDTLTGVGFRFDDVRQQLFFEADPKAIIPLLISMNGQREAAKVSRDTGALLNYSLFLVTDAARQSLRLRDSEIGGTFEARVFGPLGLASASYTVEANQGHTQAVRLDSAWTYAKPDEALSWRAGDLISGGFAWTRPLRLGGFQFRRDFSVRPDLITVPTPTLSASAAAPSTLEVMLGASVVMTRQVSAGPIQVSDLPILGGEGDVRLVLRDAYGRQQLVSASYFATPDLLRAGLLDFSVEGGFARRGYGLVSADYDGAPMGSGSVRYGLTDAYTLEAHGEAGAGLVNGGGGLVHRFGSLGVGSFALAASAIDGKSGGLADLTGQTRVAGVSVSAQAQWTAGAYQDLASVTANPRWRTVGLDLTAAPKRQIQLSAAAPLNLAVFRRHGDTPTITLGLGEIRPANGPARSIINLGFNYAIHRKLGVQISAYAAHTGDAAGAAGTHGDRGVVISLHLPLGHGRDASAGVQRSEGRSSAYAEVRRQSSPAPGDLAWSLRLEGDDAGLGPGLVADALYRSPVGQVTGEVAVTRGESRLSAGLDGGIVWLDGVHLARQRLDNAFAVVDVGAPGLMVLQQHRRAGVSDADGRLLLTDLSAYEANRVDIDIENAPLNLEAPTTHLVVAPAAGSGAIARFGVARAAPWGVVHLRLADGSFPPPGAHAALNGGASDNVVGYDGQLFLRGLAADNTVEVDLGDGVACRAVFPVNLKLEAPIHVADTLCR